MGEYEHSIETEATPEAPRYWIGVVSRSHV